MKKVSFAILLAASVVLLSACRTEELELTPTLINENIERLVAEDIRTIDEVTQHDLGDLTILNMTGFSRAGFLVVRNDAFERGVYSVALGKMLVDLHADIENITVITDGLFGAYAVLWYDDDDVEIIDAMGHTVLEKGAYLDVWIDGDTIEEDGETIYLEHVDTRTAAGWRTTTYRVDVDTGTRTVHQEEKTYEVGDVFEEAGLTGTDLTPFGLEGHFYILSDNMIRVFDEEDNRQVASFMRPAGVQRTIFNGVMFYQVHRQVQREDDKYTYTDNWGDSYYMETFAIDFKTGKTSKLDVDFYIDAINVFYDEEGIAKYAVVAALDIHDKFLVEEITRTYIINAKGEVVNDITGINLGAMLRLNDDRIVDLASNVLLNNELEALLSLTGVVDYIPSVEMLVVMYNGLIGLIDLDGTVAVPFDFVDLWDFYEGQSIAEDEDGVFWLIDLEGEKTEIPHEDIRFLINGLYLSHEEYDVGEGTKALAIRDYDGNALLEILIERDGLAFDTYLIDTPLLNAVVMRIHAEGFSGEPENYVYIGVTYED